MPFSFKSTKILLEYCNSFILFCFEAVEGTVDNEPVNIVVVPEKFSTDRRGLTLKFTRSSLLVVNHSLLVVEIACCKNSLVTRCKIPSLLVAEATRYKKSLVTRCKICS